MANQKRLELISVEERVKRDPRGLSRVSFIGTDLVLWPVSEGPVHSATEEPIAAVELTELEEE